MRTHLIRAHLTPLLLLSALLSTAASDPLAAAEACSDLGEPIYFQAGRNDVFGEPTDPSVRRPELDAYFAPQNPVWTDFDDPTLNRWVGHSFTGLPGSICRIDLIVIARDLGGNSSNDSLLLGSATAAEGFVTLPLADLTDVSGTETQQVYVLELGEIAFSGGKTVLELIEEEGLLDLLVQDDTMVDSYELRVYSSPWRTRYCGRPDAYAEPADAVQRSAQLNGAYPQAAWKSADDTRVNRFFGCSFSGLPETVFEARIEVQMKPGDSSQADNDSLNLGLRPGPSFAFSSRIEDLPEAGGTWDAAINGPTLIERDVTPLIEDRRLDVLIQDDTTVDYVRLRYRTCPPPVPCFGLTCLPVDDTLVESVDHQIRVPLPGAFELDISGGDGACVNLSCPTVTDHRLLELLATGSFEESDGTFSCKLTWQDDGNVATVSADFPEGLDVFMSVEVLMDDQTVAEHTAPVEGPAATIPTGTCVTELDIVPFGSRPKTHCLQLLLQDPTPVDILQGGPSGVVGNKVLICPPLIVGMPNFIPSGITISGTGSEPLVVESSTVFVGQEAYSSLGGAALEPANGSLRVVDLRASDGGFSVALGNAQAAELTLSLGESTQPIGGTLDVEAFGTFDGQTDAPLGRLEMIRTEDGIQLGTDFSSIDSPTQKVQVWRQGELVTERILPAGPAASASQWPDRFGKLDFETECYVVRFPTDTVLVLFGESPLDSAIDLVGGELVGDELRLLAEDGTGDRIDAKTKLSVVAGGGIEEITVLDARVGTGCEESPERLCLNQGRYAVKADWRSQDGGFGAGRAVRLTADTGYFWFFDPDNVELIVKSLDGCGLNERLWVFGGGLTNVEVELKVTDTWTGDVELYLNPAGTAFQPLQDTDAFAGCEALPVASNQTSTGPAPEGEDHILLNGGRFEIRAEWRSGQAEGSGRGVQLTDDTGYFWFFNADNVEMVVKVLDACELADRFWVFAGGLTDVEVELVVKDRQTGEEARYSNPSQTPFLPIQDTSAFSACP